MSYSIKNKEDQSKEIKLTIDNKSIRKALRARFNKYVPTAKVSGFRVGKAPSFAVWDTVNIYDLYQKAVYAAIDKKIAEVIKTESLVLADRPEISDMKDVNQEDEKLFSKSDISFLDANFADIEITIDIKTELSGIENNKKENKKITLKTIKKIKTATVKAEQKDIDKMVNRFLDSRVEWVLVERKTQLDDQVELKIRFKKSDDAMSEWSSGHKFHLHSERKDEISKAVKSKKAGDKGEFEIEKDGSKTIYEFELVSVFEKKLPKLDDDFVVALTEGAISTVADFKEDVKLRLLDESRQVIETDALRQLEKMITDFYTDLVPDPTYVEQNVKSFLSETTAKAAKSGMNLEEFIKAQTGGSKEDFVKKTKEQAELNYRFRFGVIVLSEELGIEADEKELKKAIRLVTSKGNIEHSPQVIRAYVEENILFEKALIALAQRYIEVVSEDAQKEEKSAKEKPSATESPKKAKKAEKGVYIKPPLK